MSSWTHLLL